MTMPIHLDELACNVAGSVPCHGCASQSGPECDGDGYVPKAHDEKNQQVVVQCNSCDVVAVLRYARRSDGLVAYEGTLPPYRVPSGERVLPLGEQ